MGVSVEIVDQQACAGGDVRSCMIIGDYVYVAGKYIERFPLNRVNHTLGEGEVLGDSLSFYEAQNMIYDGEYITIKRDDNGSLVRFNPSVYDNYTGHGSVDSDMIGIVQSSNGDYHLFNDWDGWEIYRFQNGNFDFIHESSLPVVYNMEVVGNVILVAGTPSDDDHHFYVYTWDGTSLGKLYEYSLEASSTLYKPTSISVFGNTIIVAQEGYNKVLIFRADWSTNTITHIKDISLGHEFYATSFNGLYYCGMADDGTFKIYSFYDDELTLVNTIGMDNYCSSEYQCQTHIDDKHMVCVDGNNVYLGKQVLKAQAEFPNGTSGEAPFHLTARAI